MSKMSNWYEKYIKEIGYNGRKKDLREVCREKYGDDFVEMYDMLKNGIPIGNLEETQIFLAMVKAAEDGNEQDIIPERI